MITLFDLSEGQEGIILKIKGRGSFRQRIMEMGFIAGKKVEVIKKAPLRDPVEYRIMGYNVSLRNSEAQLIEITFDGKVKEESLPNEVITEEISNNSWHEKSKHLQIALIGNPNSGKTTLFNYASGSREKVANYAGVTVDSKEAIYKQSGYTFSIVDLPGTYSLKSYSPEEIFLRNYIFESKPDIIVNIIDASNLERNLYLTTQLIDMGIQMVIALNMFDELEKGGNILNYQLLAKLIGVPVVPTVSSKGRGISELFEEVIKVYENRDPVVRHIHINYGTEIESSICAVRSAMNTKRDSYFTNIISARYLAVELLGSESTSQSDPHYFSNPLQILETAQKERERLKKIYSDSPDTVIADLRYGFISGALKETYRKNETERPTKTRNIDSYLTDKYLGIPIFLLFMWITFYTTFSLGAYPKHWLELLIGKLADLVSLILPSGILRDFLIDGIMAGVGGVIVFLPNILIIFIFISIMEDTGYMARAVFIMDKAMHAIGLHGKSFIPLFMGFGCNVPAIMATRIIDSRRDRLITMLIIPFMSCSARLPVYILFISAFFARNQSLILLSLYLIGVLFAVLSSILLKRYLIKSADIPFVMELPPYRIPTMRSIFKHVWFRSEAYLKKIGGVILIASVIIWVLSNFPRRTSSLPENTNELKDNSYLAMIGKTIEPVMKPLGFDWRLSTAVLSGLAAKEVVVSTMGIIYKAENKPGQNSLAEKIKNADGTSGERGFTPLVAFSFMLFILLYVPCAGVLAAIRRESGGWKWAAFVTFYTLSAAWLTSFIVFKSVELISG